MTAPTHCKIRGVLYPSIMAAARALNVTRQAVQDGLNRGTPDTIGLGRNWWHKKGADYPLHARVMAVSVTATQAPSASSGKSGMDGRLM